MVRTQWSPVAKFIRKLIQILNNESEEVICWSSEGDCFCIHDRKTFETKILPKYYKHSKLSSFQRQLNSYEFQLIPLEQYVANSNWKFLQYGRLYFHRDVPENLHKISRIITLKKHKKRNIPDPAQGLVHMPNLLEKSSQHQKMHQPHLQPHISTCHYQESSKLQPQHHLNGPSKVISHVPVHLHHPPHQLQLLEQRHEDVNPYFGHLSRQSLAAPTKRQHAFREQYAVQLQAELEHKEQSSRIEQLAAAAAAVTAEDMYTLEEHDVKRNVKHQLNFVLN